MAYLLIALIVLWVLSYPLLYGRWIGHFQWGYPMLAKDSRKRDFRMALFMALAGPGAALMEILEWRFKAKLPTEVFWALRGPTDEELPQLIRQADPQLAMLQDRIEAMHAQASPSMNQSATIVYFPEPAKKDMN